MSEAEAVSAETLAIGSVDVKPQKIKQISFGEENGEFTYLKLRGPGIQIDLSLTEKAVDQLREELEE
jgi:hypothetical protein